MAWATPRCRHTVTRANGRNRGRRESATLRRSRTMGAWNCVPIARPHRKSAPGGCCGTWLHTTEQQRPAEIMGQQVYRRCLNLGWWCRFGGIVTLCSSLVARARGAAPTRVSFRWRFSDVTPPPPLLVDTKPSCHNNARPPRPDQSARRGIPCETISIMDAQVMGYVVDAPIAVRLSGPLRRGRRLRGWRGGRVRAGRLSAGPRRGSGPRRRPASGQTRGSP